ncbi:MAG: excinuclease ABC subunit UvrC [Kiritimatiellia bacterium]
MTIPEKVKEKLRSLPDRPGCYIMRDQRGRIIYVGKAASLRKRVWSYFRAATLRSGAPKLRGLVRSVADLDFVVTRTEAEALLTEGQLIKDYKPRYNVSFRDDKRFLLLRANPLEPLPRFALCRFARNDGALYFGPYASSAATRATLDFLEKRFGLRKCKPILPTAETYRHCINDVIRHCTAPCVGKVTTEEYRRRFEEACAFLRGERREIMSDLRERMRELADNMEFERAAALRDTLLMLERIIRQRPRTVLGTAPKAEEAAAGLAELQRVLNLPSLPRRIEAYDVSNISGTHAVAGMVFFLGGIPQRKRYRHFRIKTVGGIDDAGMMAEVIRRRFSRLIAESDELPDMVLVDGGPVQVGAARRELAALGLERLPVAGLAKRFEELYRDEKLRPLRLDVTSPAIKLLQRLRDEAHRFALRYHRRLRGRRIQESILDEIPGVGPRKKELLLTHFGSVRRLAAASEEEIAAMRGIGRNLARAIYIALGVYRKEVSADTVEQARDTLTPDADPGDQAGLAG